MITPIEFVRSHEIQWVELSVPKIELLQLARDIIKKEINMDLPEKSIGFYSYLNGDSYLTVDESLLTDDMYEALSEAGFDPEDHETFTDNLFYIFFKEVKVSPVYLTAGVSSEGFYTDSHGSICISISKLLYDMCTDRLLKPKLLGKKV